MWESLKRTHRLLRRISQSALDGSLAWEAGESFSVEAFAKHVAQDLTEVGQLWPSDLPRTHLDEIAKCLAQKRPEFTTMVEAAIEAGNDVDDHYGSIEARLAPAGVADLLHPAIVQSSYAQFRAGHYRDAVFNSIVAVFDLLRARTGLDLNGVDLAGRAFSLERPLLALSALDTVSDKNDQKGFIQLLQGAYVGIRNPKAHSLWTDLDQVATAQYLVFASLLARRIDTARQEKVGEEQPPEEEAQNPPSGVGRRLRRRRSAG